MSNVNELMPSKYLKEHDVTPPKIVTIKGLKQENLARDDQPKKLRWTMLFEEVEKPLVLNKTNLKRCAKACGSEETDDWIGKKIKVYFDEEVMFGDEQTGGIRITSAKARRVEEDDDPVTVPKGKHVDQLDDDIPF